MLSLYESINNASAVLRALSPSTLTREQVESTKKALESIDISALLEGYAKGLPVKPADGSGLDEYRKIVQQKADELNKKIDILHDALEEVKKMRKTLNLPALDPVIQSAQKIIRPLFNFTASMQD